MPLGTTLSPSTLWFCLPLVEVFIALPKGSNPLCHLPSPGPAGFRSPNPFILFPSQVTNKWLYFPSNSHRYLLHLLKIPDIEVLIQGWLVQMPPPDSSPCPALGGQGLSRPLTKGHALRNVHSCSPVQGENFRSSDPSRLLVIEARSPPMSPGAA